MLFSAFLVFICLHVIYAEPVRAESTAPPNIVILVADDVGWADVGYHGSPIETPHIDRLCREGVELDRHYVAPMCTPTRVGLLTGRYWSRWGNTKPSNEQVLPFGATTLASALRSVGYRTFISGKWHLGSSPRCGPRQFGFDRSYGSLAGGVGPWSHLYKRGPYSETWHRDDRLIEEEGHVTDLLAKETIDFIGGSHAGPFFVYLPFTAAHIPFDEPEPWREKGKRLAPAHAQYAASVMHMDDAIGKVCRAIDERGIRDRTLVLFFSDNGGAVVNSNVSNYPGRYSNDQVQGFNLPLRGRKCEVYEGGIRVPAVIHWPGVLRPGKLSAPIHVTDWMPTLCGLAGWKSTEDLNWDGRDIWPILSGRDAPPPDPRVMYCIGPNRGAAAIHRGPWKLIVHRPTAAAAAQRVELYNIIDDPSEKNNRAAELPERVAELRAELDRQLEIDNASVERIGKR